MNKGTIAYHLFLGCSFLHHLRSVVNQVFCFLQTKACHFNLIEVQKNSYQWFLREGLKEVFDDISPISDYSGHLSLEFVDFELCEEDVKYSIEKCKESHQTIL